MHDPVPPFDNAPPVLRIPQLAPALPPHDRNGVTHARRRKHPGGPQRHASPRAPAPAPRKPDTHG